MANSNPIDHQQADFIVLRRVMVLLLVYVLLVCQAWAGTHELPRATPAEVGLSAEKLAEVDDAMTQQIEDGKIVGGIVAIAREGKVCFLQTYGQMDTDPAKPMREDTIFRIYSMSKAITSAGALALVDEGKLELDDPITKHIPELQGLKVKQGDQLVPLKRPITIADLMLHTAGFSYGMTDTPVDTIYKEKEPLGAADLDAMAVRLAEVPLRFQPGEDWSYSVSIDVLGLVIERASGQSLDAYLRQRLFDPLDMHDTGFYCPPGKQDRFAPLYVLEDEKLNRVDMNNLPNPLNVPPGLFSGGGGMVSTAHDYMNFLMMIRNGGTLNGKRILMPETVELMITNQLPPAAFPIGFASGPMEGIGFGFGFSVSVGPDVNNPRPGGDYGWSGAASTHQWVVPQNDLIVITLEQRMPFTTETMDRLRPIINDAVERQ